MSLETPPVRSVGGMLALLLLFPIAFLSRGPKSKKGLEYVLCLCPILVFVGSGWARRKAASPCSDKSLVSLFLSRMLTIVPSFYLHCSQGVQLLGIGTFYVLKDFTCTVNSKDSIVCRPVFRMSKVIADECNLSYAKEDVPGKQMD